MKKALFLLMLFCMLTGCSEDDDTWKQEYIREIQSMEAEDMEMQRELARWYNTNLQSKNPDLGFERRHCEIFCFSDGMAGYLEISDSGKCFPIFHSPGEKGFYLYPYSAFPLGEGDASVRLHTDEAITMAEGDVFRLYVMDAVHSYRVVGKGSGDCQLDCGNETYYGTYIVED